MPGPDGDRLRNAACVVFDFHGTLCSERFFRPLGEAAVARVQPILWGDDQRLLDRWMSGRVRARQIAEHLAGPLGMAADDIEAGLRVGCRRFVLNEAIWRFARRVKAEGRRTALVTVNMDVFTEEVVPALGLRDVFDVIVNSADEGELDKRRLWPVAFRRLGGGIGYAESFLIEDGAESPAAFEAAGGAALRYTDDTSFAAWLAAEEMDTMD